MLQVIIAVIFCLPHCMYGQIPASHNLEQSTLPVSAPLTAETSGKNGEVAIKSVFRIVCESNNMCGTCFLHKSGYVITAAHVVANYTEKDICIITNTGKRISITSVLQDEYLDLAIVKPAEKIQVPTLILRPNHAICVGTQVSTWGFPSGYNSATPLLTVGYLSGIDRFLLENGNPSPLRWVVNAAFNGGNSGGPVLSLEDGSVIGVVSSKLAPIPHYIKSALKTLSAQKSGLQYTKIKTDGTKEQVSEGQIIADILFHLRSQTQLVLGHAVTSNDLIVFLRNNGIKP